MAISLTLFCISALTFAQEAQSPAGPDPTAVSSERLGETMNRLCELPRFAGSIESLAAADFAAEVFEAAGMQVEREPYWCYLPRQTGQSLQVETTDGSWQALNLFETGFEEDERTLRNHVPPMHGLTFAGRAEGKIWYVGYGTENEFRELKRLHGDAFHGGIALVRYGSLYRGLKVANAEAYGFAGALLYTDRDDDGSSRGDVLPKGPWRPSSGIQRGSVYNADGDPLTPGWAAKENVSRILPEQAEGLVRIPSLPISSANAALLMRGAERKLGPISTTARMSVEQNSNLVEIQNVLGRIVGSKRPDEWIIIGAHRDAWGFGATDNGTGSTVLLETARVIGEAMQRGWRPERTLVFATWDAEEWGLVGSTEWVEQYREELQHHAVAYLNMDVAATGPNFSASCTPGLVASLTNTCEVQAISVPKNLGVPGGGSDHVPFLELAGIEVVAFGFHGGSGVYHSAMDTPYLIEEFLDPGYLHHAQAASFAVQLVSNLAHESTAVDGRMGWLQQILRELDRLPDNTETEEIAKLRLQKEALELTLRIKEGGKDAPSSPAFRFHRSFLPESERSLLWRTAGYGADWFPVLKNAIQDEASAAIKNEALEALLKSFKRAGR
ncbi:MAG: M28 family peptidase [Planctomycetota bacterium]|nr:M28 family peptidase [Planctomycetota bacterium]MDA1113800.1 M28 family peptidase [Planctomycetota bacterium]